MRTVYTLLGKGVKTPRIYLTKPNPRQGQIVHKMLLASGHSILGWTCPVYKKK